MYAAVVYNTMPRSLLLAFSSTSTEAGRLSAARIFDKLFGNGLWFVPRPSAKFEEGSLLLFYQAGKGVVGEARLERIAAATPSDLNMLNALGLGFLTARLYLSDRLRYTVPVPLGPLVGRLNFVTNKQYWGHALRVTPREIDESDQSLITAIGRQS